MEIVKKSYELARPCKSKFLTKKLTFYFEFWTISWNKDFNKFPSIPENYLSKLELNLRVGTLYKLENIKINRLKVFPEKPFELARSYDLAQHPCMFPLEILNSLKVIVKNRVFPKTTKCATLGGTWQNTVIFSLSYDIKDVSSCSVRCSSSTVRLAMVHELFSDSVNIVRM